MTSSNPAARSMKRDTGAYSAEWSSIQFVCTDCAQALGGDCDVLPVATRRALAQAHRALEAWYLGCDPEGESYREFSAVPCDLCHLAVAGARHGAVIQFLPPNKEDAR